MWYTAPMRARRIALGAVPLLVLLAGCGPIRFADVIKAPVDVSGGRALQVLTSRLSPALLDQLGGSVPDTWPPGAPRVTEDLPFEASLAIHRADLGAVGQDLAAVSSGQAVLRIRGGDVTYDAGDLTQTITAATLWVAPAGVTTTTGDGAKEVGYLTGLSSGSGSLVFQPGGRYALGQGITAADATLIVRFVMSFDSAQNGARPGGNGKLELDLNVDVLK